ncbi:MAG TPA: SPFH domain-containing protein [Thermodesulfobacteriaceae bacterium]|nr:SPFH domain-containing protein [Thermodesulfobacteriaceae bacterium]
MGTDNIVFMEVLEWFDQDGSEVSHRLPERGSGEIKMGAQVIVRDSQAAVFYSNGTACDALGPGRHTLSTMNVPLLTKILSLPWGFTSPFRAEVYFVNLKVFNNLRWGTRDPVAFRDSELSLVRLRAHGVFNVQVIQPVLFVNSLVGTSSVYSVADLEGYINEVIVSRLNDYLGENLDTLFNLPSRYRELGSGLRQQLSEDLSCYGLALKELYVNAITPPQDVQQAIDDRARLGLLGDDLTGLMQMKTAMAVEKASTADGSMAAGGMGMGLGMLVPGILGGAFSGGRPGGGHRAEDFCPECGLPVEGNCRFCPHCGHQILVLRKCRACGKNLGPKAKFCPACGVPAGTDPGPKICNGCGVVNRSEALFCNHCGAGL